MVTWSGSARADLRDIFDHIARDSRFYAKKTIEDLVQRSERLLTFPRIGRVVPEYNIETVRELLIESYRVTYELQGEDVEILAVIHGMRLIPEEFSRS
jgi:addiction module RelE/StbE family toxin